MTFDDIVNEINHCAPIEVLSVSSGEDISKVRLWANHAESDMETTLYFGYDRQPVRGRFQSHSGLSVRAE